MQKEAKKKIIIHFKKSFENDMKFILKKFEKEVKLKKDFKTNFELQIKLKFDIKRALKKFIIKVSEGFIMERNVYIKKF